MLSKPGATSQEKPACDKETEDVRGRRGRQREALPGSVGPCGPRGWGVGQPCPSLLPTPAPGTFSSGLSASPTSHPLSSFLPGAKYLRALRCPEGRHLMPLCSSDATGSERAPRHLVPPPHQPPRPSKPASSGCCCSLRTLRGCHSRPLTGTQPLVSSPPLTSE